MHMLRDAADAQNASIRVWHLLSSRGVVTPNGNLDQREDRIADSPGQTAHVFRLLVSHVTPRFVVLMYLASE